MQTLLILVVYAVGLWVLGQGAIRLAGTLWRRRRCTARAEGAVADVAERKSLLSWPAGAQYYPIFEYTPAQGGTQIRVSSYPAQHREELPAGRRFVIFYDPARPSRFFAQGWDEGGVRMGALQAALGAAILAVTLLRAGGG